MSIIFEKLEPQYYPERVGFRPKTQMVPQKMNFIFINGGLGDYITWMTPIRWLASEATWIRGTLIHPTYYSEIAEYFLKPYGWQHMDYETMKQIPTTDETPCRGPVVLQNEALNATGAHLMTCGWVYFTNKEHAPAGLDWWTGEHKGRPVGWNSYPQFKQADLDALPLPKSAEALQPGKYAVITTGVTTPSRHVKPEYWNRVIEYVKSLGLAPVFLGKRVTVTGNVKNIHTQYSSDLRLDLGVDLLDQTSLMQAASIMSRAAVVIGHDNGLLHLAACTEAPIVFGYNLASPEHREPMRPVGLTYNVTLTNEELACNHCQSRTNFTIGYNFRQCRYGDNKCLDLLFEDGAKRWKWAIDAALGGMRANNSAD